MKCHQCPPIAVAIAGAALAAAFAWQINSPPVPESDRYCFLGTWTQEEGQPGNSIRFYLVPKELPSMPGVQALEGHGTVTNFLGETQATAIWNFGYFDPLELNLSIGTQVWYVAIRKIDGDHLLARFGRDATEMSQPNAIDHPDTIRLKRIGRE